MIYRTVQTHACAWQRQRDRDRRGGIGRQAKARGKSRRNHKWEGFASYRINKWIPPPPKNQTCSLSLPSPSSPTLQRSWKGRHKGIRYLKRGRKWERKQWSGAETAMRSWQMGDRSAEKCTWQLEKLSHQTLRTDNSVGSWAEAQQWGNIS